MANCRGGPRLQFLAGRSNHSIVSPDNLIPLPTDSVDDILERMGDAGFSPAEVVDLLASHSVAAQDHIDEVSPAEFPSRLRPLTPRYIGHRWCPLRLHPLGLRCTVFRGGTHSCTISDRTGPNPVCSGTQTLLKGVAFPGNGSHEGEVLSPLAGEVRLQSDALLARDRRTACEWQSFVSNHDLMVQRFTKAMAKMTTLGNDVRKLTDCSEVIPVPKPAASKVAHLPAGKTLKDIERACKATPFPVIRADPGE